MYKIFLGNFLLNPNFFSNINSLILIKISSCFGVIDIMLHPKYTCVIKYMLMNIYTFATDTGMLRSLLIVLYSLVFISLNYLIHFNAGLMHIPRDFTLSVCIILFNLFSFNQSLVLILFITFSPCF